MKTLALATILALAAFQLNAQSIIFVNSNAAGGNNGTSWSDAFTNLQSALDAAASGDSIWVAAGTYKPSKDKDGNPANDTSATFQLKDNVFMFGGFSGGELERSDRSWKENETILNGDLGSNTVHHVVQGTDNIWLDGFTVTNGNANGTGDHNNNGGGMLNDTLDNITVINCTFINNKAGEGGGMANYECTNILIKNCIFKADTAANGGGIGNWSTSPVISNCLFTDNYAYGETLSLGAAIYNWGDSYGTINNCVFYNNHTLNAGGAVHDRGCATTMTNCILWGNAGEDKAATISAGGSVHYSCIEQTGYAGSNGNISADPHFVDAINGAFYLKAASPCIDAGNGDQAPEFDFDGMARRDESSVANTGTGTPAFSDMGLYEYYPNDAGITAITKPSDIFHAAEYTIEVTLENFGVSAIATADIGWKIDDNTPTSFAWTGLALPGESITAINIGSYTFEEGQHTIKAWSALPNGESDTDHFNDTTTIEITVTDLSRFYVKHDASGTNNGSSWTNAFTNLQTALDFANADDSIWIAAGNYSPSKDKTGNSTPSDNRSITFQLVENVSLFGGFSGTETALNERDWKTNETVLSGDIGTPDDITDNCYNVVRGADYSTLDGMTITNGNANGPTNTETDLGGGLSNKNVSYVKVRNVVFKNNIANGGGAVANYYCGDSLVFSNCQFIGHKAGQGGAMANFDSKAYVTNCLFVDNVSDLAFTTDNWGGAIYNWGAGSTTETVNCTFIGNSSSSGGAIHDHGVSSSIKNSIFVDNSPNDFYGVGSVTYNLTNQAGYTGANNNIGGDPLLYEMGEGNYQISWASPCIDEGDPDPKYNDPDASRNNMGASHPVFSPQVDMLISAIDAPLVEFVYGDNDVWVTMVNLGTDPITSSNINWSVDGVVQTTYNWTGNLPASDTSASFNIGNYTFSQGEHSIKAWTSNATDEFQENDTTTLNVFANANVDAGIISLDAPDTLAVYEPSTDIYVSLKNYDTQNTLNKVYIGWTLDGVPQSPYIYSDTLATEEVSNSVKIATIALSRGMHELKIWTYQPNDLQDDNNLNDTLEIAVYARDFDIGIARLLTPTVVDTIGNQKEVNVTIENYSANQTLTSATIAWEVDGTAQTPYSWTGSLPPGEITDSITLGQYDLPSEGTYNFKLWTEAPNSDTDDYHGNDTTNKEITIAYPLCDTFTISATGDFQTFNEAVDSLINGGGVCGPVVFMVETGTYTEQVSIPEIPGTSEDFTITFQSASGDSTDVILTKSAGDYTLTFNGADYVTFKNMTISSGSAGSGISFNNGSAFNTVTNCYINGESGGGNLIYLISQNNSENTISKNRLINGDNGIYAYNGTDSKTQIINNIFENQTGKAIYLNVEENINISGNHITSNTAITGIYLSDCEDNFTIAKNRIYLPAGGSGIYFYRGNNNTGIPDRIVNNFISINTTGIDYGIYYSLDYRNMVIFHNTIYITGNAINSSNIYLPSRHIIIEMKNNILINEAGGRNTFMNYNNKTSDYNCLYTTGTYLASNYRDLNSYQTGTGQDQHSFNLDPVFISESDLHTFNPHLNNRGTPIAEITTDIDGEIRDAANPDIGADEYDPLPGLSGTYAIGPSAPLFKTINEAVDSLIAVGVDAPTLFEIEDGTYNEQVSIPSIANASETDTVVFRSASADSSKVVLTYAATGEGDNYTLKLDGAEYITIRDITIEATGTDFARVAEISNEAHYNTFSNNRFLGVPGKSEMVYSYYANDTCNVFTNNVFSNGIYGINMVRSNHLVISGNKFINQTEKAITLNVCYYPEILSNYIQSDTRLSSAIYLEDCRDQVKINTNQIILPFGGTGVQLSSCRLATTTDTSEIFNNHIYIDTEEQNDFGIYMFLWASNVKIFHNTVHITGNNPASSCYFYGSIGPCILKLVNNNLVNSAGGYVIYRDQYLGVFTSNYNNLYTNGVELANNYSDLEAWQTGRGQDLNSVSVYPYFMEDTSYHILHPALNGAGTTLTEVTKELDGESRDANNPDIGADEFTISPVPLIGAYTIAGVSPDYETINDAVQDLTINGVDGAVTFNIATDTLNEQVLIPEISGASTENTITFQSASGDSSDVLITYTPVNTTHKYTIRLDGADYITFKNLSVTSGAEWGWPVELKSEAMHNNFEGNKIFLASPASANDAYTLVQLGESLDSFNEFIGNHFENGSIGIAGIAKGIRIVNNRFTSMSHRGIHLISSDNPEITGNHFDFLTTGDHGVYLDNLKNPKILGNYIINAKVGIKLWKVHGSDSGKGLIANNMIYINATGAIQGISLSYSSYLSVVNNTVKINSATLSSYTNAFYATGNNFNILNNIFVLDQGGHAGVIDDTTGCYIDYNLYFHPNSSLANMYYPGGITSDPEQYGFDLNSLSREPVFVSDTNLHTTDPWISNKGIPIDGITTDIDGETRDLANPDIGADEFEADILFAGNYSIGPGEVFETFTQAVDSITAVGAIGPVVFEVNPGTYNEQVVLPAIPNLMDTITVTFRSSTGDAADVVLEYEATAADNYIVMLDSASYIIIEQMTLSALDSTNAIVIKLENDSKNNIIKNNIINGLGESSSNILAQNGDNSENLFQGNIITGGLNGFMLLGEDGLQSTGNKIIGNTMVDQLQAGIYLKYQQQHEILGNEVSHTDPITKKWVGIGLVNCTSSYENRGLIANNMVYYNANQLSTGLFLSASSYQNVYHNNVHVFGASTDSRAFNQEAGGSNNTVINNIFSNRANGVVIFSKNPGTYDYNVLHGDSERFIYTTEWINDLPTWQAQGKGTHSLTIDPLFVSDSDLHIQEVQLFGTGKSIPEITIDFDGEARDISNVTIGADVFSSSCIAPLSGIQTIGSGKDFETINDAVLALISCGVDGDVIFEIASGTYNEQVYLPGNFTGKTIEDAITFRSASGNPEDVIISHDGSKDNNYVVKLNGLDNFVLENLTLEALNNAYGRAIEISNNSNHSLFNGNIFKGVPANENNDSLALIYYAKGSVDSAQVFTNNTFENGSKAIVKTDVAQKVDFFDVSNNSFINQSSGVIEIEQVAKFSFDLNTITTADIAQFNALTLACDTVTLRRNQIDIHAEAGNAINSNAKMTVLENNYISFTSHTEEEVSLIGIYDDIYIYYNTFVIRGENTNSQINKAMRSYGIQLTQKNNIISNLAGGKLYSMQYGIENSTSDHNNQFTNGTFGLFEGVQYGSFSDYAQASGQDANSVSANPVFMNDASWYSRHVLLNNTGTPVDGITTDLEGNARDAATPDIGAEEFATATYSMGGDVRLCADDSYTILAGVGFDSYNWSTGSDSATAWIDTTGNGMGAQEITLTATIGGTAYSDTIIITLSSPVATPITDYCFNEGVDSIQITAGDGDMWDWNSGDTTQSIYISTGNYYYVTVTDEYGCSSEGSINVHFNSCLADINTTGESVIPENESITLLANQCREDYFRFDYSWSTGDTTSQITLIGTDLGIGTHEVVVSIANAHTNYCTSSDTMLVTVEKASGLNHNESTDEISIYPNPTKGMVYIKSQNAMILGVEIYNLQGNMLFKSNEINNSELNMTGYKPGIYLIQIETERQSIIKRLIIE